MQTLEPGPAKLPRAQTDNVGDGTVQVERDQQSKTLLGQLQLEAEAMARYTLLHGLAVPPEMIAELARLTEPPADAFGRADADKAANALGARARELASIHGKLTHIVAPATPQGITLLDTHRRQGRRFGWLGPVPLIRALTVTAIGFLIALVATALSPDVNSTNIDRGLLASSGTTLLWNTLFLLCCAGLGAAFAALFQAHRYIANSTYDPKYDASYGARLILGVIAGLILVEMLPSEIFTNGGLHNFRKPTFAMLGGFSATVVHRLLQHLVDTVETLVQGDASSQTHASVATQRAHAATERVQSQNDLAARMLDLQQSLDAGATTDEIKQRLSDFTRAMLSSQSVHGALSVSSGDTATIRSV